MIDPAKVGSPRAVACDTVYVIPVVRLIIAGGLPPQGGIKQVTFVFKSLLSLIGPVNCSILVSLSSTGYICPTS